MVKISGFASVNPEEKPQEGISPTLEAEEVAVIEEYERGIHLAVDCEHAAAEAAFRSVLNNPLVASGMTEQLHRLQLLAKKNLALAVSNQENRTEEALSLFQDAIMSNPEDVALLDKFGTLAARAGEWTAAKEAFMAGLRKDRHHLGMQEKLLQVLEHLGDRVSYDSLCNALYRLEGSIQRHDRKRKFNMLGDDLPKRLPERLQTPERGEVKNLLVSSWEDVLQEIPRLLQDGTISTVSIHVEEKKKSRRPTRKDPLASSVISNVLKSWQKEKRQQEKKQVIEAAPTEQNAETEAAEEFETSEAAKAITRGDKKKGMGELDTDTKAGDKMDEEVFNFVESWGTWFHSFVDTFEVGCGPSRNGKPVGEYYPCTDSDESLRNLAGFHGSIVDLEIMAVFHFCHPSTAKNLPDALRTTLISLAEKLQRPIPALMSLTLAEIVIEEFEKCKREFDAMTRRVIVARDASQEAAKDLKTKLDNQFLLASKYLARYREESTSTPVTTDAARVSDCRYWWSRGRLQEARDAVTAAKRCFSQCIPILEGFDEELILEHCKSERVLSVKQVELKLEKVDLHAALQDLAQAQGENKVKTLKHLSSILLDDREREEFLAGVDVGAWSDMLDSLKVASSSIEDYRTMLRCQIRLLYCAIPPVDAELWECAKRSGTIACRICESRTENVIPSNMYASSTDPEDLLELARFVDQMCPTSKIVSLNFAIQSLFDFAYFEKEITELDDHEKALVCKIQQRLLVLAQSCFILLTTNEIPFKQNQLNLLKKLLTGSIACMVGLWGEVTRFGDMPSLLSAADYSLEALDKTECLLFLSGAVPYMILPYLVRIHSILNSEASLEDEGIKEQCEVLIEHCMFFLFGLVMPSVEQRELGWFENIDKVPPLGQKPISKMREIELIWPYCESYLLSLSGRMLKDKLGPSLERVFDIVESELPDFIKSRMGMAVNKMKLEKSPSIMSEVSHAMLPFSPVSLHNDSQNLKDIHLRIFSSIFYLKNKTFPIDFTRIVKDGEERILSNAPDVEGHVNTCLWDLAFTPSRAESWMCLGEFYHEMTESVLTYLSMQGRSLSEQEYRVIEGFRHVCHWALTMCIRYADDDWSQGKLKVSRQFWSGKASEMLGISMLEQIEDAPPLYNQWCAKPDTSSSAYKAILEDAMQCFISAARFQTNNFYIYQRIGCCMRDLGHQPDIYIPVLAYACELARNEFGSLVDPIYALHSSRLELILSLWDQRNKQPKESVSGEKLKSLLDVCGQQCFLDSTTLSGDPGQDACALFEDAVSAMQWCLERTSLYKARLSLYEALKDDPEESFNILNPLFTKGKQSFGICMWPLSEKLSDQQERMKKRKKEKARKEDEFCNIPYLSQKAFVEDIVSGKKVKEEKTNAESGRPKLKSVGIWTNETNMRLHQGRTRKALLQYLDALMRLNKMDVIEEMIQYGNHEAQTIFPEEHYRDIKLICQGAKCLMMARTFLSSVPADIGKTVSYQYIALKINTDGFNRECLQLLFDACIKSLASEQDIYKRDILGPVTAFMSWRLHCGDTSWTKESKLFLTKNGRIMLKSFASLHVTKMCKEVDNPGLAESYDLFKRIMPDADTDSYQDAHDFGEFFYKKLFEVYKSEAQELFAKIASERATSMDDSVLKMLLESTQKEVKKVVRLHESMLQMIEDHPENTENDAQSSAENNGPNTCLLAPVEMASRELIHALVQEKRRLESKNSTLQITMVESLACAGIRPPDPKETKASNIEQGGDTEQENHALAEAQTSRADVPRRTEASIHNTGNSEPQRTSREEQQKFVAHSSLSLNPGKSNIVLEPGSSKRPDGSAISTQKPSGLASAAIAAVRNIMSEKR